MQEPTPALIGIDWGTTNLRAFRLAADGTVLEAREAPGRGLMNVAAGGYPAALAEVLGGWAEAKGGAGLPVLAAGMVGARQGWHEVPYAPAPAGLDDLAAALFPVPDGPGGLDVRLVPGVIDRTGVPDVMRGEEAEILGLAEAETEGPICLPGTHSKWVAVEAGRIARFATFMSGEVYGLMRARSILARTMPEDGDHDAHDPAAFARGVARSGAPGGPLHHLFGGRTLALTGDLAEGAGPSYLSGLLIGAEIRAAAALIDRPGPVTLVGAAGLVDRYADALALLDRPVRRAAPDAAGRGLARIARAARLV